MSALFAVLPAVWAVTAADARAGTVLVETATATEVRLDNHPVLRTFGPAQVTLSDVPSGERTFAVFREGRPTNVTVQVPEQGVVRIRIGETTLSTDRPPAPPPPSTEALPPMVELRAPTGQEFAVLLDGEQVAVLRSDQPLRLAALTEGEHPLELRSTDLLTIWVRGTLALAAGDEIVMSVAEGRKVEVFGRPAAWRGGG